MSQPEMTVRVPPTTAIKVISAGPAADGCEVILESKDREVLLSLEGQRAAVAAAAPLLGTAAIREINTYLDATTGGMAITFASVNKLGNALPTFA